MSTFLLGLLSIMPVAPHSSPLPPQEYDGPNYSYLEAGFVREKGGDSGDFGWGGSYSISDSMYLFGNHTNYTAFSGRPKMRVGLGIHKELQTACDARLDLYASGAYANREKEWGGTEPGGVYAAGMRGTLSAQLEFAVGVEFVAIDRIEDNYLTAGGVFNLTDQLGLGLSYARGEHFSAAMVSLRISL